MAQVHPIVRAIKKIQDKQERRITFANRLVIGDLYLNKKSIRKLLKLI